jgi:hypothetical protein
VRAAEYKVRVLGRVTNGGRPSGTGNAGGIVAREGN